MKYYYDSIMSPFKPKILEAVEKVRQLPLKMIATGHGPILDQDFWKLVICMSSGVVESQRLIPELWSAM